MASSDLPSSKLCCVIAGHRPRVSLGRAVGFGNRWEPSLYISGPMPSAPWRTVEMTARLATSPTRWNVKDWLDDLVGLVSVRGPEGPGPCVTITMLAQCRGGERVVEKDEPHLRVPKRGQATLSQLWSQCGGDGILRCWLRLPLSPGFFVPFAVPPVQAGPLSAACLREGVS